LSDFTCITGATQVVALIGDPVEHSRSPVMHNVAFQAAGLNLVYIALPVAAADVEAAVVGLRALNLKGANVTMPHKTAVIPYLDEVSTCASLIGAVNTIVRRGGRLVGDNTDGRGFVRAVEEKAGVKLRGRRVFLFGAGGAARAVALELARIGVSLLTLTNRNIDRAEELAARVNEITGCETTVVPWNTSAWTTFLEGADVIVNCTRAGMLGEPDFVAAVPWSALKRHALVCDAVYEPLHTNLLKTAAENGHPTLDGLSFLLYQGVLAFELWTGVPAPVEAMARVLYGA
jgi:shikimate dehydrogenase